MRWLSVVRSAFRVAPRFVIAFFAAAACDGETTSGGSTSNPPTGPIQSVNEFALALAHAYCRVAFSCYAGNDDVVGQVAALESEQRCVSVLGTYLPRAEGEWAGFRQAEQRGNLRVDPAAAARCLDFFERHCFFDVDLAAIADCRDALVGEQGDGEDCNADSECAGGGYCEFSGDSCPGACRATKQPGATCEGDAECAPASGGVVRCEYQEATSSSTCSQYALLSPAGEGEPCGTSAMEITPCGPGLWCDGDASGGICRPPIPVDGACTDTDDACERGAFCSGPADQMTCQRVELLRQVGAPCDRSLSEVPRLCDVFGGLTCVAGVCEAMGDGSEGTPCNTSDSGDVIPCTEGLYCDQDTATCIAVAEPGEPCDQARGCTSSTCDRATGVCAAEYCAGS